MTLRPRHKKFKPNESVDEDLTEEDKQQDLTYNAEVNGGASYIRYEILDKKGKQYVVPVRYSIRRQAAAAM